MKDFKKGLAVEGSKTENQPGYFSELFHLKDAAGQNIGMGMYHENESDPTVYYLIEESKLVPYITDDLFNKYG